MEAKQITSKIFSLQARDFLKGLLIAALSPVFTIITTSLNQGSLVFNWRAMGVTGLSAGLAYLAKNFFEPTQTVIIVKPALDKEEGEKEVNIKQVQ